jgi:hypothetical protein
MNSNQNIPVYGTLLGVAALFFATFLANYLNIGI